VLLIQGTLSISKDISKIFTATLKTFNKLDILIYNAGTLGIAPSLKIAPHDSFSFVMNVILRTAFQLSQLALAHIKNITGVKL